MLQSILTESCRTQLLRVVQFKPMLGERTHQFLRPREREQAIGVGARRNWKSQQVFLNRLFELLTRINGMKPQLFRHLRELKPVRHTTIRRGSNTLCRRIIGPPPLRDRIRSEAWVAADTILF